MVSAGQKGFFDTLKGDYNDNPPFISKIDILKGAITMEITEKVAYLKGLMEGMKIDTETNEGKILSAMVDILEDIGLELEDLWNAQGELEDGLDVVSDDLEDIEDIVYDEDDEESFDDEYYEDDAEEDEDCYATTCPTCEETIYFDESVLEDGEVICPNCGEKLEFDMSSLEEDSDDDQE